MFPILFVMYNHLALKKGFDMAYQFGAEDQPFAEWTLRFLRTLVDAHVAFQPEGLTLPPWQG